MRIIIKTEQEEAGQWAANYIIQKINKANPTPEKPFVLGLPTGSSPLLTLRRSVMLHFIGEEFQRSMEVAYPQHW